MIPKSKIPECPENEVKPKIENIFANEKILGENFVKIYKIGPYFCEHYKEKIQVDKNGCKYILLRIDVYFTKYLSAVETDEKKHVERDLIFEEKGQEALETNLVVCLLELIQVSVMINKQLKKIRKRIKQKNERTRRRNKKTKT